MSQRLYRFIHRPTHALPSGIEIRSLRVADDWAEVVGLWNRSFPDSKLSAEEFEHYMLFSGEVLRVWVATPLYDKLIGVVTAAYSRDPRHPGAHIHMLCVDAKHRNQGIGLCLAQRALNYLIGLGFVEIWGKLHPNEEGVKVAEAFGAKEVK